MNSGVTVLRANYDATGTHVGEGVLVDLLNVRNFENNFNHLFR